jgi:hypothetical protein
MLAGGLRLVAVAFALVVAPAATGALPSPVAPGAALAQEESADDAEQPRRERRRDREAEAVQEPLDAAPAASPAAAGAVDDTDCIDFATRDQAQAVLDADPSDPFNLDPNGDGIACGTLPTQAELDAGDGAAPSDDASDGAATCADLSQEDAQALLDEDPSDPQGLDPDGDGIACESDELDASAAADERPRRRDRNRTDAPAVAAPPADLDCANFSFQDEAQLVLDDDPSDPYNLDPNDDGFACTSLPARFAVTSVPSTGAGGATPLLALGCAAAAAVVGFAARGRRTRAARST